MITDRLIPGRQARAALLALALASLLCASMVVIRARFAREVALVSFFWNLFLAWIPLLAALPLYGIRARGDRRLFLGAFLAIVWFLFFPNAPYIVTDLVHLRERPPVPYWYDMITIMAFALTGLFLGYLSLYLMQEIVRSWFGRWPSWLFAWVMLGLSAFGIYLGRFLRWNSWDVLVSPLQRFSGAAKIAGPAESRQAFAFTAAFFGFSMVCYLIVYSFTHLHAWVERTQPHAPPSDPG